MKRKKFIKYLMGYGVSRNKANSVADFLLTRKVPYKCFGGVHVISLEKGKYHVSALVPGEYAKMLMRRDDRGPEPGFYNVPTPGTKQFVYGERIKAPMRTPSCPSSFTPSSRE